MTCCLEIDQSLAHSRVPISQTTASAPYVRSGLQHGHPWAKDKTSFKEIFSKFGEVFENEDAPKKKGGLFGKLFNKTGPFKKGPEV